MDEITRVTTDISIIHGGHDNIQNTAATLPAGVRAKALDNL